MSVSTNLPIDAPVEPAVDENAPVGAPPHIVTDESESEQPLQPENIDETIADILSEEFPGFDPSVHAIDKETGKPKMRGDGSFALKRGRKSGAGTVPRETSAAKPQPEKVVKQGPVFAGTENAQITNLEAARQMCNMGVGLAVALIGPEWAPRDKDEGNALVAGFKNYFDAKGQIQLSPEWGLAFTVLAYSLPRIQHENTRSKFSKAKDWCVLKYVALRERFGKKG